MSEGLATIVPGVAGMITKMAGALVVILIMEPRFAYILVPGGILLVLLTYIFRKQLKKLHKQMQEKDGFVRIFLQEHLGSLMIVKAFGIVIMTLFWNMNIYGVSILRGMNSV